MALAVELRASSEGEDEDAPRLLHALASEAVRLAIALDVGVDALDALEVPDASERGRAGTAQAQKLSRTNSSA